MSLPCNQNLQGLLRETVCKHYRFYGLICLNSFATEKNLNHVKKYGKIKILVM